MSYAAALLMHPLKHSYCTSTGRSERCLHTHLDLGSMRVGFEDLPVELGW